MTNSTAKQIADLLNNRGFVIDEEIKDYTGRYTKFPEWIKEHENLLREEGYEGGSLMTWATRFDAPGCAYGITDADNTPEQSYIESFCETI